MGKSRIIATLVMVLLDASYKKVQPAKSIDIVFAN